MGSGISTQQDIIQKLRTKYEDDPTGTTRLVNACKKEVTKLNRTREASYEMPNGSEIVAQFREMDFNGNNIISLAEIDKFIVERYPLLDNKPALMRAYRAADKNNSGLISLKEYTNLWEYIVYFNQLWEKFERIDVNMDRRIDLDEFKAMAGELFDTTLSEKEATYLFDLIDVNNGGMILFNEFCTFMIRRTVALA